MKSKKDERIGVEFTTNEGYKIRVINYINSKKVTVKFLDYDYKVCTHWNALQKGNVKNPFHPSVYGVGYLGVDKKGEVPKTSIDGVNTREYNCWKGILERCSRHKAYKNVTVCERWKCYAYFLEDLPKIEGYKEWLNDTQNIYQLDKDLKQQNMIHKIYSVETCIFITQQDNVDEMMKRTHRQNAVRVTNVKTGEVLFFKSQRECAKQLKLCHIDVWKSIKYSFILEDYKIEVL